MISCEIAEPLAYIINLSVRLGQFPDELKIGKIIPIKKSSQSDGLENCRPITILNIISKIIEKVVYNRIVNYLNKHKLLTDNQHGFRSGKSTETASCNFVNFVYSCLDKNLFVGALFFDLSKAFDTIDLSIIKDKLEKLGFRDNILNWLMSYLHYRKIYVEINGYRSELYGIDLGVPQGSVLGPLIFLLYINDLVNFINSDCIVLFADDTTIAVSASNHYELQDRLNEISIQFTSWCNKNRLLVNAKKTLAMNFFNKRKTLSTTVSINGILVDFVDNTKFLGVHIDSNMRWQTHIDIVSKKINSGYYAILQLKSSLDNMQLINVYYALIYSAFSYNVILWGNATGAERILILQKRVMRLIFDLEIRKSCRQVFKNNNILTFPCVFILKSITYIKMNIHSMRQNRSFHNYSTRGGNLLRTEAHNTSLYEHSPMYTGTLLYNKLPETIRGIENTDKFKRTLKTYLISKCYYSVKDYLDDAS